MTDYDDVPVALLDPLRAVCRSLPEVDEEQAWTGSPRWRVRGRTFAHVLTLLDGTDSAVARAVGGAGRVTVVTFRAVGPELEAIAHAGHPFFVAGWGRDVVGLVLDDDTDWSEVAELITESYCVLAPKKLIARVDRPPDPEG